MGGLRELSTIIRETVNISNLLRSIVFLSDVKMKVKMYTLSQTLVPGGHPNKHVGDRDEPGVRTNKHVFNEAPFLNFPLRITSNR